MANNNLYLSIVIPAYNEERRIVLTLDKVYDYLSKKNHGYEVILVDDGSSDATVSVAGKSKLAHENRLTIIRNGVNRGKGFSVRQGFLNAKGEYVLFTDADMSTPIEELDKLIKRAKEGIDLVIGSRSAPDSNIRVHQPWLRERMGKVFNFFVRTLFFKDFQDTQCGFKLIRGSALAGLVRELKIDGFCFDVELIYLAKMKGHKVAEAGVIWDNSIHSKVRVVSGSLSMFRDLLRIKTLHKWAS